VPLPAAPADRTTACPQAGVVAAAAATVTYKEVPLPVHAQLLLWSVRKAAGTVGPIASQVTSDQVVRVLARPCALTLPFNSQDIGTSRWQLPIERYANFPLPHGPESRLTLILAEGFGAGSRGSSWRFFVVF
jgi:hypothetical protein